MKIYHGSIEQVVAPEIRESNRTLDYGQGFYTTTSYEQADDPRSIPSSALRPRRSAAADRSGWE